MVDKVIHVRLEAAAPQTSAVLSLGPGPIPVRGVSVEVESDDVATLTLRIPLIYVDLEVCDDDKEHVS